MGLAYVLAAAVAERLRNPQALRTALDLFCIGTIADMAPLTGVNRRWLQEGLPQLHRSALPGLRALAELSGLEDRPIDSQGVGFAWPLASMPLVAWPIPSSPLSCSPQ